MINNKENKCLFLYHHFTVIIDVINQNLLYSHNHKKRHNSKRADVCLQKNNLNHNLPVHAKRKILTIDGIKIMTVVI